MRRHPPASRAAAVGALFAAITGCAAPSTPAPPAPAPSPSVSIPPVDDPDPQGTLLDPTDDDTIPVVHPGAYCDRIGAHGTSPTGRAMACIARPGEERPRWRRAV